jgi:hypothetical protein
MDILPVGEESDIASRAALKRASILNQTSVQSTLILLSLRHHDFVEWAEIILCVNFL